ncbi:MarR family winged helix-turn-helix transcriptional regulator [Nocardioides daejeonensis]|uniref:MarR family winged helix-turn-helix transcriptional regulator n=1 Tax=Nocardioides daejeonensis TaxID=1046556 RepID=UPI0013A58278|nr:MarR family transcriptional regulator [Nocardioides daejeonensis]
MSTRDAAIEELTTALFSLTRGIRSLAHREVVRVEGLRRSDVALLRQLVEHGAQRPGAVADRLGVGPSVVSRQLTSLVAEGLVTRRTDPADGRADLLDITEAGRARLAELLAGFVAFLADRLEGWDDAHIAETARILEELHGSLNPCTPSTELEGTAS